MPQALISRSALALLLVLLLTPLAAQRGAPAGPTISSQELARIWDAERVSPPVSPLVDHAEIVQRLNAFVERAPDLFTMEQLGESVEGRSIHHVRAGTGPMPVLLWSQMHGDEPTATSALFDLFEYLIRHRQTPAVQGILGRLTLHVVPMLNPDGAERFQRRNAQSIDINRDALRLQTPEGQILKVLRDRVKAEVGFNLHNQNWRTSVGDPPKPASMSLLSVAFDEKRSDSPGRRLTRQLGAVIRDAIEPFASGQIGRYTDEFEVRAFGDNITLWGTPVLLIETGPWPSVEQDPPLVRLNFIALVTALDALATGSVRRADPARYESLPLNESRMFYVLVRHASVINGAGAAPYTADIGINASRRVRIVDGRRDLHIAATIDDMGDLRANAGLLRTVDASGMFAVPDTGYEEGALVDLPDWRRKGDGTIAVGQPARIALLRPDGERYRVELLLRW
jgi:hypothetical protein